MNPIAAPFTPDFTYGLRLLASTPDCVKVLDLDGRLQFMNDNGLCLFEADQFSSLKGQYWSSLWPAESQPEISRALKEARAGQTGRFEGVCPTTKGTPKWWDVAVSPVYDPAGNLTSLLAISRDVTKEKATEQALRISEERFRALADNIAQFAWMADAGGYIFWYNQRWFDYTGTTLDEMKGWGWKKVQHPDHVDRVVAKISTHFENGNVWEDTFPLRAIDGTYRWFLSRAMPIRDDKGRVTLWCGTNTDVTDQRSVSQRLRQLARLIELSHEAIIVRSPTNGIILWNRGCVDLYGYTQAEALGQDSHLLLKSQDTLSPTELETLVQTEGTWSGELVREAKDGTRVWVDCRKQVIRIGDDYVVLESDRDITERRKADDVRNLLVAELNHRVKNTLAIVQSLASQTAKSARTKEDFVASFNGRLQSLSSAHNVLTDSNWSGAWLHQLIKAQMDVIVGESRRIELRGQDVFIPSQLSVQLTLVVHELATNALKHGALSDCNGRILISWDVDSGPPAPQLHLKWEETGGPPVKLPNLYGFGVALIERTGKLPHLETTLQFNESGIVCTVAATLGETSPGYMSYFNPAMGRSQQLPV